jgi:hypothetical protein
MIVAKEALSDYMQTQEHPILFQTIFTQNLLRSFPAGSEEEVEQNGC